MPAKNLSRSRAIRSGERLAPIARRSWSASAPVNPAISVAICMSCSWNSGIPSVRPRAASSAGWSNTTSSRPLRLRM